MQQLHYMTRNTCITHTCPTTWVPVQMYVAGAGPRSRCRCRPTASLDLVQIRGAGASPVVGQEQSTDMTGCGQCARTRACARVHARVGRRGRTALQLLETLLVLFPRTRRCIPSCMLHAGFIVACIACCAFEMSRCRSHVACCRLCVAVCCRLHLLQHAACHK